MSAKHWAEYTAEIIIKKNPEKAEYVLAAGITPSGTVHIGNFRELITVEMVGRALKKLGKKVKIIFSWDDYDVFRKVPADKPKVKELTEELGKPISEVFDPHDKTNSYARYNESVFEEEIKYLKITPEIKYQSENYKNLKYNKYIKLVLEKRQEITAILNKHRKEKLPENWLPFCIYCSKCRKSYNEMTFLHKNENVLKYECNNCGNSEEINVDNSPNIKLLWRIDWPMRWTYEKVDFEPGGKDHSSDGGSYDTAKEIAEKIFNYSSPVYLMYDFISIKGKGGKISSSSGNVIALNEVLEIYEPEVIKFLFALHKNNTEFAISFDLDMIKIYEDYDRIERQYYGKEECGEKKKAMHAWIYELSSITENVPSVMVMQPAMRHLCNINQIYDYNENKVKKYYGYAKLDELSKARLERRMVCAVNWLKKYAPEEFVFKINEKNKKINMEQNYAQAVDELKEFFKNEKNIKDMTENKITEKLYALIGQHQLDSKTFYALLYQKLINKDHGPKLAGFLLHIPVENLLMLLNN